MKDEKPKQTRLEWALETAPNSPFLWSHEHGASALQILVEAARELGEPPKFEKIDVEYLDITWGRIERGLRVMLAFDPDVNWPVATIWFRWCGGDDPFIEIIDSYVKAAYRRQGIRSKMNEAFFERWKATAIVTDCGTEKFGEPFMKASGYVQDELGRWMLTRKAWEASRAEKVEEK